MGWRNGKCENARIVWSADGKTVRNLIYCENAATRTTDRGSCYCAGPCSFER